MKVEIYSTPTCGFCTQAKTFFANNNIAFTDYNVASDANKAQEMVRKSGQTGVPFIVVTKDDGTEESVLGFDEGRLRQILGLA